MEKRVLALILASVITLTNGNIAFAAEADNENTTDTMVMEEAVGESTQPKPEEVTESEEPEEVAEDNPAENEEETATNTVTAEKMKENMDTTTSESTENITVETPEDVPEQGYAKSGTYGENITWTYDAGTLRFSGKGNMNNISNGSRGERAPWYHSDYRDSITNIVIEEGITSVGSWAFISLVNVTTVTIPSTVTVIQPHAFQNCQGIKCMNLPNGLTAIGVDAFLFMDSCEEFKIDDKSDGTHPAFYTEDGVLFNNKTLITYPQGNKRTSYRVPYGTEELGALSFANTPNLQTVYIPETMIKKHGRMFYNDSSRSVHMSNPLYIYFSTAGKTVDMNGSVFQDLPSGSKIYVKNQESCNQLNSGSAFTNKEDVKAEVYQQTEPYSAYEALKKTYENNTYRLNSGRTTLFRYEAADAPTAKDTTAWTSNKTDIAISPDGMGYITGGTKPGTATITVTREDKKDSFSFTVENVVPTTSTELYHKADGKQQVLGNSLYLDNEEKDTITLKTEPELTTALNGKVKWTSSDSSKVIVKASGIYNEKAVITRNAVGDVTITASMTNEDGKDITKSFTVTGRKSTTDWKIVLKDTLVDGALYVDDPATAEPTVCVMENGKELTKNTDYSIRYEQFPGWYETVVYVTGMGDYSRIKEHKKTIEVREKETQTINGADSIRKKITDAGFNLKYTVENLYYLESIGGKTGALSYTSSNKSVAEVTKSGKVTIKGAGQTTITVTAASSNVYKKSKKKVTLKVTADISDATVTVNDCKYNGKFQTPKTMVQYNGNTLKQGTDYIVSCTDNKKPGTATAIIKGKGIYSGEKTVTFTIKKGNQKISGISSDYKKSYNTGFTLKPKAKGKITYKTSNKKVATVNSKGKVTVKGTGKATITVTAKATSTYSKCVKKITVYGVPKKPEMKKLTAGKKKFTVQWKKDKKADGYQVQYSTDKKFKKNVKSVNVSKKSTKATVKKLKKRKTYRVRVRSYKKINGKKYYSGWGKVKSVKVK